MTATSPYPSSLFVRFITWPARHIRWKIILPYALLTIVLAFVGSYLATRLVTGSLEERFENQLADAGRVTADSVVRTERAHLETVRAVAFTDGVSEAVVDDDATALRRLVEPVAANQGAERVEVLDGQGRRLLTLGLVDPAELEYEPLTGTQDPAGWPLVQQVLSGESDALGDKFAQVIETDEGFVLYTAGPVTGPAGTVGAVLVGTKLSTFLARTQGEALADVTVYDFEGVPVESTFVHPDGGESREATLDIGDDSVVTAIVSGATVRESRTMWGRSYDFAYSTLTVRDQAIAIFSVALPTDFIFSAGSTTRTQVALLFGGGIVAVLAIGFFLAHRFTQPILKLVRTASLVASGDLTARSGVRTPDEIGELARSFDTMTAKLQRQHVATIKALTSAIDARDPYTLGHSVRVGQLAVMIGRELDLNERMLGHLETGGYLHDIGKIGIRDAVLLKPDSLTPDERRAIKDHPTIGLSILRPVELPPEVIEFVGSHHERLDGSGYPGGITGGEISIVARIAAVCDMYDAFTTDRPYRDAVAPDAALRILVSQAGRLLDRRVVEALRGVQSEWERRRAAEAELRGFDLGLAREVTV